MQIQSYYDEIKKKFDRVSRREYGSDIMLGIQVTVIGILQLFTALAFFELIGNFSSLIRTILFLVFIFISLGLTFYFVLYPLLKSVFSNVDYQKTAGRVGNYFPYIKDDLLNAFQLVSSSGNNIYFSDQLSEAAFRQIYQKTSSINFSEAVSFSRSKSLMKFTVAVVAVTIVLFVIVPGLGSASNRLINYNKEYIPPAKYTFEIIPGNARITKGENITLKARVYGAIPPEVSIATRNIEQSEFQYKKVNSDSAGIYSIELSALRSSFNYFFSAEDVNSEVFEVKVIDKPMIRSMEITLTPPAYSRLPQINQKDNGNVSGLIGSRLDIKLSSTKDELKSARLIFSDSSQQSLKINGRDAYGSLTIRKDMNYQILLNDSEGNLNENPVTYSIKALYDEYPVIEMVLPNSDVTLGEVDRLPVTVKIQDDYGFNKLLLHYRLSASKYEKIKEDFSRIEILIDKQDKENDVNYIWNLSPMHLATDDVVTYYLEIFDNDNVSGPKSSKTGTFNLRVPSLDELFEQADQVHESSEKKLMETLAEAQKLKENLEKISQDLKQDKKDINWQEKENIENALEKFNELESKIDDIKNDLAEMQNELQQNNLLSKETLEKYMELQELFEELGSEEMRKAMEKMEEMLKTLNRDQIQKAMENMKFNEEQMQKSIERTMNLLKRVQIEQKMNEIMKRTESLQEKLDKLQEETKKSDLADNNKKNELADQQKNVSEDMKSLEEKLKDLQDKMSDLKDMPNEQMEKMLEEFEKQQNDSKSQMAENQLKQGQKQQAQQNQQQLSQNMQDMQKQMSEMQNQMQMQNQRQVFSDMMKTLNNLLTMSKEQEKLKDQSKSMDPNSSSFNSNAKKQSSLQQNMDKVLSQLNELSQKTFAITPEMGRALGKANMSMKQSMNALQNRNGTQASKSQGDAMSALNEAASLMKGSMESMMNSGGSGGGMMSLMQQLQQLSQQQMQLNNMTQQMNQGSLSMQQQAELQRLAAQQEAIRKSLEQLNEESKQAGQSKKIPANMDRVLEEMREVVTDMNTEKLNDDLIQKQERILSKLLDAQRSINERDFEKNRESNSGENLVRESPAELNLSSQKAKDKLRDELMHAIQEGYAKDYEDLIRRYYEALQKSQ